MFHLSIVFDLLSKMKFLLGSAAPPRGIIVECGSVTLTRVSELGNLDFLASELRGVLFLGVFRFLASSSGCSRSASPGVLYALSLIVHDFVPSFIRLFAWCLGVSSHYEYSLSLIIRPNTTFVETPTF
jgi:hypothetical protein